MKVFASGLGSIFVLSPLQPSPPVSASRQALLRHETPTRSASQRQTALVRANAIRVKRAGLKRDLKAGDCLVADVLQQPAEWVVTAKVFDLLVCVPGIGVVKAAKVLQQCRVSASKSVGGLSDRQRGELVALLRR